VYYWFTVIIIITILCLIKQNYIYIPLYTIYIYIIDTVHNYIYIRMILRCWYNIFTIRKQSLPIAAIFSDSAEGSEIEEPRATAPEAEANQFGLWQRKPSHVGKYTSTMEQMVPQLAVKWGRWWLVNQRSSWEKNGDMILPRDHGCPSWCCSLGTMFWRSKPQICVDGT